MKSDINSEAFIRIIEHARKDPFFVGWTISEYENAKGTNDMQLAEWLECALENMDRLVLCRLPNDENERFQQATKQIAAFVSCNANKLVQMLREVAAISSLRKKSDDTQNSFLMAARDHRNKNKRICLVKFFACIIKHTMI